MPSRRTKAASSGEKILYPGGRVTQRDVLAYYEAIARFLLPHLRNRPITLKRYPGGVFGEVFYEKDAPGFTPRSVKTFPVPRRDGGSPIHYILVNDRATLKWAVEMDTLEFHPFLHRVPRITQPTHLVFDLDPGEGANILDCGEVAILLRDVLARLRLKSFVKVSGSKGLQLYVPLNVPVTYDATQPFARAIAELMERNHPDLVVADMAKNLRAGKVFIDWSQNADHKTTVTVYSLRAKAARPFVSVPLRWPELEKALRKSDAESLAFAPDETVKRVARTGDLFAPLLKLKQKLPTQFLAAEPEMKGKEPRRALQTYRAKRDFARTAEPAGEAPRRSAQGSRRRFVIQKHAASHLHYDFRLEMNDVLKSWAVPKGLPLQQSERRTGFETEDHPLEYLKFEGVIPQGEYGGGTVMVWDIGTYEVIDGNFWKGSLNVFLTGKKLKGEWSLRRQESQDEKARWLIEKRNGNMRPLSAEREASSALSGRTMEKIAEERSAVWRSDRGAMEKKPTPPKKKTVGSANNRPRVQSLPSFVKPMKASAVGTLPEGEDWIYEVKWDGYRVLAAKAGSLVRLWSLKEKNLTQDFPTVAQAMAEVNAETALIDGEVVAVNDKGCPSFQMLQNRGSMGDKWEIVYYAFDLLYLDGVSWRTKPLRERKDRLRKLLTGSQVRYNAELSGKASAIAGTVSAAGLEGVIAKRAQSLYQSGTRTADWLKFKLNKAQEFVIGGYKPDAGSFQSILVGYYEGRDLMFAGKVRQGFHPASRRSLLEKMRPLRAKTCPFANLPTSKRSHFGEGITTEEMEQLCWLKPKLVSQVSFTEWTNYGLLRHATFGGLRDDKEPRAVVRELG